MVSLIFANSGFFAMPTVSHRPGRIARPVNFKLHHYRVLYNLDIGLWKTQNGRVLAEAIMSRRTALWILGLVFVATSSLLAQKGLTAVEAKAHIGEQATVCGKVVSTRWAESSHGSPTFLNFDQPYPDQVFTMVIWGSDRAKFGDPETTYRGKHVCVTGKIRTFKGVPEVVATEPSQIRAQ